MPIHFSHTVVVTDTGCERLSRSDLGLVVAWPPAAGTGGRLPPAQIGATTG